MTGSGRAERDDDVVLPAEPPERSGSARPSAADGPAGLVDGHGTAPRANRGLTGTITSTQRVPGPAGFYYADVPNRIMAMIIDIIVLSIMGFFLALLFGGLVTRSGALDAAGGELDIVPFLAVTGLQLVISVAYFGYLWVTLRATVGMKLLGLQIGDATDGHSISWRQALIRWLIIGVPSILASLAGYVPHVVGIVLGVIGVAWLALLLYSIARSPTKQGWHDRRAHTIMLKRARRLV